MPRRSLALPLAAALLLSLGFSAFAAVPALADDIDAISGTPSDGVGADTRTTFDYQLAGGQQITDYFLAKNTGTTSLTATVFATDAFNADDGGYSLLDTSVEPKDVGGWVTFDGAKKLDIALAPGESKVVTFVLDVPANAAPGDHAGGILMSVQKGDGQVLVDRRIGTRLYVRVPGDLQPILSVSSMSATYSGSWNPFTGTTKVTATVKNTGNVALGAEARIGVKGIFGIALGSVTADQLKEMLPGAERVVHYEVSGVGQWAYLNPYLALTPTVSDSALNPGPLSVAKRDIVLFVVPWWLLILLGVVALVVLFLRLRAIRDERAAARWVAFTEAEANRAARENNDAALTSPDSAESR